MRITADLVNSSISYLNPLKERELDLRGNKIPAIENMGVTKDHDSLDLTDNDIPALTNFSLLPRLRTLLVARNRVSTIQPQLSKSIPNLRTLVLTNNRMKELADLDPLGGFAHLTHLVLLENPVARKENYRYWILWRCPSVRYLDYQKVKDAERKQAIELFGSSDAPTTLAQKVLHIKSSTFDVPATTNSALAGASTSSGATAVNGGRIQLTPKERERVNALIRNARSLEDVIRYENDLKAGRLPIELTQGTDEEMS